ncbi:MAG: antibiotic biosynthesis monooxygenase [Atopobiaceae bacterium]|nr:antibiotic biosynthesis monooxygenase [Atopobiaceae bacterium]
MIKIVARFVVKEDLVDKATKIALELVEKSRAEAGNVEYSFNRCLNEQNVYAMLEIWRDREALDSHNASEHFTTLLPQFGECLVEEKVELFEEV